MRKFACTLSLFVAALGLIWASSVIKVRDYLACVMGMHYACQETSLFMLLLEFFIFVIGPIILLAMLWFVCAAACKSLRGER